MHRLTPRASAFGITLATAVMIASMLQPPVASAAVTCGYTPFTGSTSIFVKKSGEITCRTAKIRMRSYLRSGRSPRGWRCTDNRTDYYLCVRKRGSGRAYGRLDTTRGE